MFFTCYIFKCFLNDCYFLQKKIKTKLIGSIITIFKTELVGYTNMHTVLRRFKYIHPSFNVCVFRAPFIETSS